jgi:hypothetical protein
MYPLIFGWHWPDIPGPEDWMNSTAGIFFNSQIGMLKFAMSVLFGMSKATQQLLESDWFSYRLGGWTNLGVDLFPLVVICVTAYVLIRYRGFNGKHYARLIRALIVVLLFVRLFYPLVGFIYDLQQELYKLIALHFAGGDLNSLIDQVTHLANPVDVVGMFVGSLIGWLVALCMVTVSMWIFIATIGVSLLYPVIAALSPIGSINGFFARVFHWANATLMMVIFSPILMVFWLALSIAGTSKAQDLFPVGSTYVGIALEIVALILCIATPIGIMYLSYHASLEVFARVDGGMRNAVHINSSNPLTVKQAMDQPDHNHRSLLRQAVTSGVVSALDDRPSQPLSQKLADQAAMLAMATGHAEIAAAAKLVSRKLPDSKQPKTPRGGAA